MQNFEFFKKKSNVYLGLGSNIDNPKQQLAKAVAAIGHWPNCKLQACSSLYRSQALPRTDKIQQPDFYNLVLRVDSALTPRQLLLLAKAQESRQGRWFGAGYYANRRLDIDILLFNQECFTEKGLTIPHPGLYQRDFVLRPLLEIAPDLSLPPHHQQITFFLSALTVTFVLEVEPFEKHHDSSITTV